MKCHKCNQDSIDINNGHILCDVCGLDIDISLNLEEDHFFDLFFYNKNLDSAEALGVEAFGEGTEENPYSIEADQLVLHKAWELGYYKEKLGFEYTALSFSSEKIEKELRKEIEKLELERDHREMKIDTFITANCTFIENFCSDLQKRRIIGKILNKDVLSFFTKYKVFIRDVWGTWRHPD